MHMPLSQLWSVLYFTMLLLLGMGSMLGNITAIITPLRDFKLVSHMSNELLNGKIQADHGKRCHHNSCDHQSVLLVYIVPVNYHYIGAIYTGCDYKQNQIVSCVLFTHPAVKSSTKSISQKWENFWSWFSVELYYNHQNIILVNLYVCELSLFLTKLHMAHRNNRVCLFRGTCTVCMYGTGCYADCSPLGVCIREEQWGQIYTQHS